MNTASFAVSFPAQNVAINSNLFVGLEAKLEEVYSVMVPLVVFVKSYFIICNTEAVFTMVSDPKTTR